MQLNSALYRNATLFFLTFFVLVVWAFWPSYYSHPLTLPSATHEIHGLTMTAWCTLLIVQAYLIRTNRRELHRLIGKLSYVVAPMVVLTGAALAKRHLQAQAPLDRDAQAWGMITIIVLFSVIYGLAIYYRRSPLIHGRLMIATVFPIVPPMSDRLFFRLFPTDHPFPAPVDLISWGLFDAIVLGLAIWDWQSHRRVAVFPAVFVAMVLNHAAFVFVPKLPFWHGFADWLAS